MSLTGQRIVNFLPRWTAARRDSSSLYRRFVDPFAKIVDNEELTNRQLVEEGRVLKYSIGTPHIWFLDLDTVDQFTYSYGVDGSKNVTYHTSVTTGGTTIERVDYLPELLRALPGSLDLLSTDSFGTCTVYDSTVGTYTNPPEPARLYIDVQNGTDWLRTTNYEDLSFDSNHFVEIVGLDQNYKEITEQLFIRDEGPYLTRNVFRTVTSVKTNGFDSEVGIYWCPTSLTYGRSLYKYAYSVEHDGPLFYRLKSTTVSGVTYFYLEFFTRIVTVADRYIRDQTVMEGNEIIVGVLTLLDASGLPYEVASVTEAAFDGRLYAVGTDGLVRVYEFAVPDFEPNQLATSTQTTLMELHPTRHHVEYGATERMFTWFARLYENISTVTIGRRSPSGTVEYLQSDRTWNAALYIFTGETNPESPEQSWEDIVFYNTFNEIGQWDFFVQATTETFDGTFVTSVMVPSSTASIEFDVSSDITLPAVGCFYNEADDLVVLGTGDRAFYHPVVYKYIADPDRQRLIFREEFSSITVVP